LSASSYRIPDTKTGEISEMLMVYYLPTDKLTPEDDAVARGSGEINLGMQPSKVKLPYEMKNKVKFAPAIYDLTLKMVTRQLKTQIQPVDIEYVSNVELSPVYAE